jgi:hypothetical protein
MATPKLDRIITEFSRRIAQPATFDALGNLQNGIAMTAAEYVTYVNRAMFKLIEDTWLKVMGDEKAFIRIFPELVKVANISFEAGTYSLAITAKDFAYLIDGRIIFNFQPSTPAYARKLPQEQFTLAKAGALPYNPTAQSPAILVIQNTLHVFPSAMIDPVGLHVDMLYIAFPLDPATGAFLTQNGAIDSPFLDSHNTLIAEIAESLYRADSQSS